jgi:CBS domain-containing protein
MIQIRRWMSKPVICVKPEDTIHAASKKMVRNRIGCVVVKDEKNRLRGILTERDILRKLVKRNFHLKKVKVEDIMTKYVKTVSIHSNVLEILRQMKKGKFRDIPITENGNVVGIITSSDLIKMLSV